MPMHNTLQTQIDTLIAKGNAGELARDRIHVTDDVVCESAAGHYVGTWCVEFIGNEWVPMPYSRDTDYMPLDKAEAYLAAINGQAPVTLH